MDGGGVGMKSKNVVEMNRYPHKQNCNISISMELSTIDIILLFGVSDTFGSYVILLSSFVFAMPENAEFLLFLCFL